MFTKYLIFVLIIEMNVSCVGADRGWWGVGWSKVGCGGAHVSFVVN
jgi:hypothetical protein